MLKLQITNFTLSGAEGYKLQITNYKLQITSYKSQITTFTAVL
jgi:hypothetical protein